jgi:hypothetical protein
MPAWEHLPASDRHSLVLYLKTLSKKFAKFVKKGKTHKIVTVPEPPDFTLDSLARGKSCSYRLVPPATESGEEATERPPKNRKRPHRCHLAAQPDPAVDLPAG